MKRRTIWRPIVMRHAARCAVAGILLASTSGTAAHSASWTSTTVWQWYQRESESTRPLHNDPTLCETTAGPISGSCGLSGLQANLQAASLPRGILKASTSISFDDVAIALHDPPSDVSGVGVIGHSWAGVYDTVTFGGLRPATLRFTYHVDGSIDRVQGDGDEYLNPGVALFFGGSQSGFGNLSQVFDQSFGSVAAGSDVLDRSGYIDVPVGDAATLYFSFALLAAVAIGDSNGAHLEGAANSDFFHTAHLGAQALDANGSDITARAKLRFGDGSLAAAPEPATWALLVLGFGSAGAMLRRRARGLTSQRA